MYKIGQIIFYELMFIVKKLVKWLIRVYVLHNMAN